MVSAPSSSVSLQKLMGLLLCLNPIRSAVAFAPRKMTSSSTSSALRAVKFAKYEGLGNDFILVDDRDKSAPSLTPEQSAKLCNRNFGIGGDGVIFALKPPSDQFDFTMRIYNSDGSEPEMCGNGIRCFAKFLQDLGEDGECFRKVEYE